MEIILRAVTVCFVVWLFFRIAGKRTLRQMAPAVLETRGSISILPKRRAAPS